jgi:hypothetical protein
MVKNVKNCILDDKGSETIDCGAVIDFSSGLVAHGQWKLIQTSDFCQM